MFATSNEQLALLARQVVSALHEATRKRGLEINYDRGKTELLWNIMGKGSKSHKLSLHNHNNSFPWTDLQGSSHSLAVCPAYKHLGTWVQLKHRHSKEVTARIAAAKQQFGQLSRSFFTKKLSPAMSCKGLPQPGHFEVALQCPCMGRLPPQMISKPFPPICARLWAPLLRGVLPQPTKYLYDTSDLFALCGILPLEDQVHAHRLRYLARMLPRCPEVLWQLLHHAPPDDNWITLCMQSFAWLCRHYDKPLPAGPDSTWTQWLTVLSLDAHWKGRIRKTCKLALAWHTARAEYHLWHFRVHHHLSSSGVALPDLTAKRHAPRPWCCDLCNRTFASSRALAMHASRQHGYRKKARYWAAGGVLPGMHARFSHAQSLDCTPRQNAQVLPGSSSWLAAHATCHGFRT